MGSLVLLHLSYKDNLSPNIHPQIIHPQIIHPYDVFLFIIADDCEEPICGANVTAQNQKQLGGPFAQARSFEPRADALLQPAEDGALMASYSVFVVEPGAPVGKKNIDT